MNKLQWIVIAVLVVAIGVVGFFLWQERDTRTKVQKTLDATVTAFSNKVDELHQKLDDQSNKIVGLDKQLKDEQAKVKKCEDEKEAEIAKVKADVEEKVAELKSELEKAQTEISAAQNREKEVQDALDASKAQVASLNDTIKAKDSTISELQGTVADWQKQQQAAAALAEKFKNRLLENKISIEPEKQFYGNVLVVNREQDFLILDLGKTDDIPVGTKLNVVRDNHLIGKITVDRFVEGNDELSIATVDCLYDQNDTVREATW